MPGEIWSLLTDLLVPTYEAKPETPQRSARAGDPEAQRRRGLFSVVSHLHSY